MKLWLSMVLLVCSPQGDLPVAKPVPRQDPAPAPEPGSDLVVERSVKLTLIDPLNTRREIHRRERLYFKGTNFSLEDLTFGARLIIRPDQKRVWVADPLRGEYSELSFEELAAARKLAFDDLRGAKARLPGTAEEKELDALLEGLDQFAAEPKVDIKTTGGMRELLVNGDRVRLSVQVNPELTPAAGMPGALASIEAFHPAIVARFKELGGFPVKGTARYVLFLDRVVEQFETTSAIRQDVPDAAFALPPGLKRVPLGGLQPAPERQPAKPAKFERTFKEDELDRLRNPLRKP